MNNDEQIKEIMDFNEGYKTFITKGKTERLCVNETKPAFEAS